MKINFTLLWSSLGGGTKILFRLANELADRGHTISLVTLGTKKDLEWFKFRGSVTRIPIPLRERAIRKYNSLLHDNPDFREKFYIDTIYKISRHIPDCDINVATYALTALSVLLSGKGKPFYYMQHYEPMTYINPFFRKIAEMSYFLPLQKIVNSTWLEGQIRSQSNLDITTIQLYIIPSAVDTNVFSVKKSSEFVKNPNKKRIVCMGKTEEWKGFKDALAAMKMVFENRKEVEFFVYAFKDNLAKDPKVPYTIITDIQGDRLAQLLSSADIVIVPSWYESSPLPGLEAMACGATLVTTRYGTEDFAQNRYNAIVVSPKKPQELAQAIIELLDNENLRQSLIKSGFDTVNQFTWQKTVDKVEEIFKNA